MMTRKNYYTPIQQVRDAQPIRATCFHPSGEAFVVGTNSKALKICKYPSANKIESLMSADGPLSEPELSFTCLRIHCASVYCATFNQAGNLLVTGSNDQVVHIIRYDPETHAPVGSEYKLNMHNGTVRDVLFLKSSSATSANDGSVTSATPSSALLLSAGGGDFQINLTDCNIMRPIHSFKGHEATVMSLHTCEESRNTFVSGSLDGTIRLWDVRAQSCVSTIMNEQSLCSQTIDGDSSLNESSIFTDAQSFLANNNNDGDNVNNCSLTFDHKSQQLNDLQQQVHSTSTKQREQRQSTSKGVPVGVVRLDESGRLLVSGHHNGSCMFYDARAGRIIQLFQAHAGEIRTVNFSPKSYYLLTGSYDRKVRLTDLQGQLMRPLPSVEVVELDDKVVQTAWHPVDYNFVTTCADGSATLWSVPDFDSWRRDSIILDTTTTTTAATTLNTSHDDGQHESSPKMLVAI